MRDDSRARRHGPIHRRHPIGVGRGELALRRSRDARRLNGRDSFECEHAALREIAIASARRILGDPGLSEQVAQEALCRAFQRWHSIEGYARPWVSRVATNLAIDEHRRRREQADDELVVTEADASDRIVERAELRRAFEALTPKLRRTVELRIVHQLDPEETATRLGCTRSAVLKNTTRGLKMVREALAATA